MKKQLQNAGYTYKSNANDMTHKQFYLQNIAYANSETTVFNGFKLDREETYIMFLRDIDSESFKASMEAICDEAIGDGIANTIGTSIDVEYVENGYEVTMNYIIQG